MKGNGMQFSLSLLLVEVKASSDSVLIENSLRGKCGTHTNNSFKKDIKNNQQFPLKGGEECV